ncbi:MAG: hypothetical protein D4S00_05265 [Streptomycetaceae bacterium]|nr:MAG: hypothetical protein D4S00_05265 [Streptomycetaceae bacterium]
MVGLILFAIPICIADWQYRRIPNIYCALIGYGVVFERLIFGIASLSTQLTALLIAGIGLALRMGMGDAKLFVITVLATNLVDLAALGYLVISIYIVAIAHVLLVWAHSRAIPHSIPMAFSIFLGSALYLAARSHPFLQEYADALVNSW